ARALLPRRPRAGRARARPPPCRGGAPPRRHVRRDRPPPRGADRQRAAPPAAARARDRVPRPLGRARGPPDSPGRSMGVGAGPARLGREVVPRLTNAHNFIAPRNLSAYRFLCSLSRDGVSGVAWSWGALESAPHLPRVRIGRTLVALRRWRLSKDELGAADAR